MPLVTLYPVKLQKYGYDEHEHSHYVNIPLTKIDSLYMPPKRFEIVAKLIWVP